MENVCVLSLFGVLLLAGCPSSTTVPGDAGEDIDAGARVDAGPRPVPDGCVASLETCNAEDDDCDGHVDEGSPLGLGCPEGQCIDGVCGCAATCDGECVNTATNPSHCGACGNECDPGLACDDSVCCSPRTRPVDLLFVVDNSNSMAEEQISMADAFPRLVEALISGDGAGVPPVTDLHVGVVSTDMGTGAFAIPTCSEPRFGDDGVLSDSGNTMIAGCAASYPSFLTFSDGLASDFACVARLGTGGCGFEQPLEAMLKAVTPSTEPTRFFMGTVGHADGSNRGFVRADSVLAVVLVTDENDCSAADAELFDPLSTRYEGDLNLRCHLYPEALTSTDRYVNGLLALRADPRDVVFGVLAGVPAELIGSSAVEILDAPAMQETINPDEGTSLVPSCNAPDRGVAFPPRRLVEVARDLDRRGARVSIGSICEPAEGSFLSAIGYAARLSASVYCD